MRTIPGRAPSVTPRLRAVVFKGEKKLVVACVDYHIANQADTLAEIPAALNRALEAEVKMAEHLGKVPFRRLPPAPARIQRMWDEGEPLVDAILPIPVPLPSTMGIETIDIRQSAVAL